MIKIIPNLSSDDSNTASTSLSLYFVAHQNVRTAPRIGLQSLYQSFSDIIRVLAIAYLFLLACVSDVCDILRNTSCGACHEHIAHQQQVRPPTTPFSDDRWSESDFVNCVLNGTTLSSENVFLADWLNNPSPMVRACSWMPKARSGTTMLSITGSPSPAPRVEKRVCVDGCTRMRSAPNWTPMLFVLSPARRR